MFHSWACMIWIFLHTLAFSITEWKSSSILVPEFLWLIFILYQFQFGLRSLTADEWLAYCGMASIFLFFKSSLWNLHPCHVKTVGDVTDCCFLGCSSQLSSCFCNQLLLFSLPNLCGVCCLARHWFLSFFRTFQIVDWLCFYNTSDWCLFSQFPNGINTNVFYTWHKQINWSCCSNRRVL